MERNRGRGAEEIRDLRIEGRPTKEERDERWNDGANGEKLGSRRSP
jgi:hypothetical protein